MFESSVSWAICYRGDPPGEGGETCGPKGHAAFKDEPSHDQHITDIFGSVRLNALIYALPFLLQSYRIDSCVTLK